MCSVTATYVVIFIGYCQHSALTYRRSDYIQPHPDPFSNLALFELRLLYVLIEVVEA